VLVRRRYEGSAFVIQLGLLGMNDEKRCGPFPVVLSFTEYE